ncbi:MAG: branched-chain amino acid aminotransferase [Lentisphaerae bacterium]|nr:branched-chain amino acid aminotransferase [Lentisphaerota bacterium]
MQNIDWNNLGFEYIKTNCHVRSTYKDGKWGRLGTRKKDTITMNVAATCLHYGQACFEGLKAFCCKDGKVRIFRPEENLRRMNDTANYIHCPELPESMFIKAVRKAVSENIDFVPPYGTGGSMYLRPLLIGTGPKIGVAPGDQYDFMVLAIPVGAYYKGNIKPVDAVILDDYDRSAPRGTGHIKMGGNYAAGLYAHILAKKMGFPIVLYLDSKTKQYVDEFGTSNFIGITKDGKYVTPDSKTILPSITNKSLTQIARDMGITVERRTIAFNEIADFAEIGACGTAVVITPIGRIVCGDKTFEYDREKCGPVLKKLYDELTRIQYGEVPDRHGWLMEIE